MIVPCAILLFLTVGVQSFIGINHNFHQPAKSTFAKDLLSSHVNVLPLTAHSRFAAPDFDPVAAQAKDGITQTHAVYSAPEDRTKKGDIFPVVTLFTTGVDTAVGRSYGDGVVQEMLKSKHEAGQYHQLLVVDVSHEKNAKWYAKYKYDLPVLHMGNLYWTKGMYLTSKVVSASLHLASDGDQFPVGRNEPNASYMEKYMADQKEGEKEIIDHPRRSRSGSFQKMMVRSTTQRGGMNNSCKVDSE
mmetsp:Transcript_48678/g.58701  ORF Transcript_48678/g.58701 Transcript_48678/m.58701 type:complete len:245 (-) Transcript_48678:66-800(-)